MGHTESQPCSRWTRATAAALLIASLAASQASAQIGVGNLGLPREIITAPVLLTPEQERAVRAYVEPLLADLAGDDPEDRSQARERLSDPVRAESATAAFRQGMADAALPALIAMIESGDAVAITNAMQVVGDFAVADCVPLIERLHDNPNPGLRVASARATLLMFEAMANAAPALSAQQMRDLIRKAEQFGAAETHTHVSDAWLRALAAAGSIRQGPEYDSVVIEAWQSTARLATAKLAEDPINERYQQSALRVADELLFLKALGDEGGPGQARPIAEAAAGFAAEVLGLATIAARDGEALDEKSVGLVRVAERVAWRAAEVAGNSDSLPGTSGRIAGAVEGNDIGELATTSRILALGLKSAFNMRGEQAERIDAAVAR
ncbi:MAG: hypothetical protein AAF747_04875 [Planctomycetota bacterium]